MNVSTVPDREAPVSTKRASPYGNVSPTGVTAAVKARVRVGSFNKLSFVEGYREARHVKGLMLPVLR